MLIAAILIITGGCSDQSSEMARERNPDTTQTYLLDYFENAAFAVAGMPLCSIWQAARMDYALEFSEKDFLEWGDFYRSLLQLNLINPALWNGNAGGDFQRLKTVSNHFVYTLVRLSEDNHLVTAVNLSDTNLVVSFEYLPGREFQSLFQDSDLT